LTLNATLNPSTASVHGKSECSDAIVLALQKGF
jgi:hypothetical protein